ncbi:MAG TPA: excinuclease ABC subunit UvrB [Ignavibacteriales bacterium]|nr:excinuclease ABC subunit UvrB [Ignavibacteriales bacterium]HOL81154.1 excinuclease ABC subunit UvrB [Ignavibacteriales bacterium]HPP33490.1 excinuclease ABC subunit UvrB [Ignavibacteriales bacterium]
MYKFKLNSKYKPTGNQPQAIEKLVNGIREGKKHQILKGITGSGKTFTVSNVIQEINRPVLIISPNKTLAAQLYGEFKNFFPENRVEFFISYYDYYQPEAYVVSKDLYIEKDFSINDEIDRLRLKATTALLEGRNDVIIVASVSCIYGIGAPEEYAAMIMFLKKGQKINKKDLINHLVQIFYNRNDYEFERGTFRVRGDIIEVLPAYELEEAIRIELWGDEIEKLSYFDANSGKILQSDVDSVAIYPAKYFVSSQEKINRAVKAIKKELNQRLKELYKENKIVEAQRLEQRTLYDIEMIKEIGYCSGIENYSRHMDNRPPGSRPYSLIDYFPQDYLLIVDESHITIPQVRGMYNGDRIRKQTLVEHGFRLPSALDNRPMTFEEFEQSINQVIYVSATPGDYELEKTNGEVVEQIIRPTGLLDPKIEVRPIKTQIDDLTNEIRIRINRKEKVLVTTLTKRMAEDLTTFLTKINIKVRYIHSDIDSIERVEIIRSLRLGEFDVLIGVNLLREGLDMPEVSLIAILDADKEGFLRSERSLFQMAGRAARNANGMVILYADTITKSMKALIDETNRRREIQMKYNEEHRIKPETVYKSIEEILATTSVADTKIKYESNKVDIFDEFNKRITKFMSTNDIKEFIAEMTNKMYEAAEALEFELAAKYRDEINKLESRLKKQYRSF